MKSKRLFAALSTALLFSATSAAAEIITFDEIAPDNANCCYLTTEYADRGVTFVTTDDGSIWAGLSAGNPGAWFLEGTNGPAFLGFNGTSFSAQLLFDSPITEFSLDMAPSVGWRTAEDVFTLEGYRGGVLVDQITTPPLPFAQWMNVKLTGEIDEVVFFSSGPSPVNAFGVDNLQWMGGGGAPGDTPPPGGTPPPGDPGASDLTVEIDVKPKKKHNFINLFKHRRTRIALLGSESFAVESVDLATLAMGPDSAAPQRIRVKDINKDGHDDLVMRFRTRQLGIALGDPEICLTGATLDGQSFSGCDAIETLRKRPRRDRDRKRDRDDAEDHDDDDE